MSYCELRAVIESVYADKSGAKWQGSEYSSRGQESKSTDRKKMIFFIIHTMETTWSAFGFVLNRLEKLNTSNNFIFKFMSPITF